MDKSERPASGEPDYRTTFRFVLTMLAGFVIGWLAFLAVLWGRH